MDIETRMTKTQGGGGGSADVPPSWAAARVGRVAAPLREQVLTVVRQAILDFELKPGQRLIERELVEHLGVSRTTVREVLARLASEGLVTFVPQKGAIVAVPSIEVAEDIYEMRASLEALAVQRFIERASVEQVRHLRAAFVNLKEVTEAEADTEGKSILVAAQLRAKDALYEVLFEGASSPPLTQMVSMLQGQVRMLRATSLSTPGRALAAVSEIGVVVDAIEAGDAALAAQACVTHVHNACKAGVARLTEIDVLPF